MASHRVGSGSAQSGAASSNGVLRGADHKPYLVGRPSPLSKNEDSYGRNLIKQGRGRKTGRSVRSQQCGLGLFSFLLLFLVAVTLLGGNFLVSVGNINQSQRRHRFLDNAGHSFFLPFWFHSHGLVVRRNTNKEPATNKGNWNTPDDSADNVVFGRISVNEEELLMRDSRDWDKDDRQRGAHGIYSDENPQSPEKPEDEYDNNLLVNEDKHALYTYNLTTKHNKRNEATLNNDIAREFLDTQYKDGGWQRGTSKETHGGLYNEKGREELRMYEEQLESGFKRELEMDKEEHDSMLPSRKRQKIIDNRLDGDAKQRRVPAGKQGDEKSFDNAKLDHLNQEERQGKEKSYIDQNESNDDFDNDGDYEYQDFGGFRSDVLNDHWTKIFGENADGIIGHVNKSSRPKQEEKNISKGGMQSGEKGRALSKRAKRRRPTGFGCDIDFRNSTKGLREPGENLNFANFSLKYIETEEKPEGILRWEPRFAGHQLLEEREESFIAKDQAINCGFICSSDGLLSTGFNLTEEDREFLGTCKIAVSSCNFGNSDIIRSPRGKKFTGPFKKEVCFVMFVDEHTLEVMMQEDQGPDAEGYVGLWKIVVVKKLPYLDARRNGKIPKFLTHRLFPAARYSIWLDSKLRLQSDPVLIIEYFLWRGGYEYAISNHYDRHCVWEEVQQNKKLNKFNHTLIDEQFAFYQADGLPKFNASDPNKLLPSYVPEGSFIVRAHTPMSNLFSCLWFNEVDRFTSRDQLSFAYTYLKLVRMNPDKRFYLNMFKDCERKTVTKLFRHRRDSTIQLQRHDNHAVG